MLLIMNIKIQELWKNTVYDSVFSVKAYQSAHIMIIIMILDISSLQEDCRGHFSIFSKIRG